MDSREALEHLESLINYETRPRAGAVEGLKLDSMQEFMGALGDPQTAYPVIHITGTNGKGSTARMLEAILTTMGLNVGLYTSPHLAEARERIRVGGEAVTDDEFALSISDVVRVEEAQGLGPRTWFDTVTSAALLHFANEAVDVAVVEVGMLGRYDSTNVVEADVAVVTNVALDHSDGAEGWRRRVAEEKAGIVVAGRPVVVGENDDELRACIDAESPSAVLALGSEFELRRNQLAVGGRLVDIHTPRADHDELFVRLHGEHQGQNAAVAIAAAEEFFDAALAVEIVTEALDTVEVPGRLEVVHRSPLVLVDAAHNVAGALALDRAIEEEFASGSRRFLVIGMQDGRDPAEVLAALGAGTYEVVVACRAPSARGIEADVLAAAAQGLGARVDVVADVDSALDHALALAADDDLVVVAGSITVIAAARRLAEQW